MSYDPGDVGDPNTAGKGTRIYNSGLQTIITDTYIILYKVKFDNS